jgi:general secretion pathway protein E
VPTSAAWSPIREDITRYIAEFFNLAKSVRDAQKNGATSTPAEQLRAAGRAGQRKNVDANDQHIVHIVDWLLQYAFEQRASDIHLEPRRDMGVVRFRIDGVLHKVYQVPTPVLNAMTSRIKILGRMDVVEKRRPQDGRIKTRSPGRARGRAASLDAADRVRRKNGDAHLRPGSAACVTSPSSASIDDDLPRWNAMTSAAQRHRAGDRPHRLGQDHHAVFHAQATGHRGAVNVCTVEDPIEMVEPEFNQMQVHQCHRRRTLPTASVP